MGILSFLKGEVSNSPLDNLGISAVYLSTLSTVSPQPLIYPQFIPRLPGDLSPIKFQYTNSIRTSGKNRWSDQTNPNYQNSNVQNYCL